MGRRTFALVLAASLAVPGAARAAVTVYPVHGASDDDASAPKGPGVVVMGGGTDVGDAFSWMHDTIVGSSSKMGGDVVILRDPDPHTGRDDDYATYLLRVAPFHSVRTIVIASPATPGDFAAAIPYVDRAEAVFFGGGDQFDYVAWRGDLLNAVQRVYDRGGVIGGTSAGAAILGQFVNDAIGERHHGSTLSPDAIANPFEASITLSRDLFAFEPLRGAIVDTHFRARDRFGRLGAYMARVVADGYAPAVTGIGVEEGNALVVDAAGRATLMQEYAGKGGAWILRGGAATRALAGQPLAYSGLSVTRLDAAGQSFDLRRHCGGGTSYVASIDGAKTPAYVPAVPYDGAGGPIDCMSVDASTDAPGVDASAPGPTNDAATATPQEGASPSDARAASSPGCACSEALDARGDLGLLTGALAVFAVVVARRRVTRGRCASDRQRPR